MLARAALLSLIAFASLCRAEGIVAARQPIVVYDSPSENGRPLYLLGLNYPVIPISQTAEWIKVCMHDSDIGYVSKGDTRAGETAVVLSRIAVRKRPDSSSQIAFNAARGLLLEVRGKSAGMWLPVQHQSGQEGYIENRSVFSSATGGRC